MNAHSKPGAVGARPTALRVWQLLSALLLAGCAAGPDGGTGVEAGAAAARAVAVDAPTSGLGQAQPGTLRLCGELPGAFKHPRTVLSSAETVPAGALRNAGQAVGAHCRVVGHLNERTSPVDGQRYAIGFEVRLPVDWQGRLLVQANGGTDGFVVTADGGAAIGSGGLLRNGLQMGFAVVSADAGHNAAQNPLFGLDPQARLDYGYAAVGSLTPMAKALVRQAYGREPDRSYIAGTSNGGRHAVVAAARYPEQFDGALAHAPGLRLPLAALANMANAQRWAQVAPQTTVNGQPDLESALPPAERAVLARAVLARCDALDGLADGLVQDVQACRSAFDPRRDLTACTGGRDGQCLSAAQIEVIAAAFAPVRSRAGLAVYSGFPFDPGIVQRDWAEWKFRSSVRPGRNPVSVGYIFAVPPVADRAMAQDPAKTAAYALGLDLDTLWPLLHATDATYREAAMAFMPAPQAERLDNFRARGAKLLVFHGTADPIFSVDDTEAWYRALDQHHQGQAARFARFYRVPGMGHSRGGPATDQYDALSALVNWVEKGQAPEALVAQARGPGNAGGVNPELPADWSPGRTRPLCPYPQVARYRGGDPESAHSFACRP